MLSRNPYRFLIISIFSSLIYFYLGNFSQREDSTLLILGFGLLFLLTYVLLKHISLKSIFLVGVFYRLIFLIVLPWLSQDFYRFIWDGLIFNNGINPYAFSPDELISSDELLLELRAIPTLLKLSARTAFKILLFKILQKLALTFAFCSNSLATA